MVQDDGPVGPDGVEVLFDDERAVSDAGVALVAALVQRLGIEARGAIWCGCVAIGPALPALGAR
jgi:hypothetical protein